jgi:hypothetical protein
VFMYKSGLYSNDRGQLQQLYSQADSGNPCSTNLYLSTVTIHEAARSPSLSLNHIFTLSPRLAVNNGHEALNTGRGDLKVVNTQENGGNVGLNRMVTQGNGGNVGLNRMVTQGNGGNVGLHRMVT